MGRRTFSYLYAASPERCFDVLREVGSTLKGCERSAEERPHRLFLKLFAGSFLRIQEANIELTLTPEGDETRVAIDVYRPGQLIDPFGLYSKTARRLLDPFEGELGSPRR